MKDKIAIVTGGTGALGRKVVEKLADEGIKVYVPTRNLEEFNLIFDNSGDNRPERYNLRKIYSFICNATDESSVIEFVRNVSAQENGSIDFLINTVGGISGKEDIIDLSAKSLDKMLDLNFKSAFYFSREVLKHMKDKNYGRIISIGAMAGLNVTSGRFAYSFSKAGVISLMDTISEEMKEFNIRCNTIIPGIIDTPSNREWGTAEDIKTWVTAEEIAKIVYTLISDEFSNVRSSHIKVYGSF